MENINKIHWGFLLQDPKLGPVLSDRPKIVYKIAHNIINIVAPSRINFSAPNPAHPLATFL